MNERGLRCGENCNASHAGREELLPYFWGRLYFLAFYGAPNLAKFGTLGTVKMEMVFDVTTMKNVVNNYDNSFEILLMSMISFVVIAALIAAAMMVVTSNYQLQKIRAAGKKTNNFLQDINVYLKSSMSRC